MKRRLASTLLALLVFLSGGLRPALAGSPAGSNQFAAVSGTSSLNIRSGPDSSYSVQGQIAGGAWVEVLQAYSGNWYQIRTLQDSFVGYVMGDYLKIAGGGTPTGNTATINNPDPSQFLNLRQYPSFSAPAIGIYYNGTKCQVMGETDGWYYVAIEGQQGYFRGEYLSFNGSQGTAIGSATVYSANGGSVNMRSGPGYGYDALIQLNPGTKVSVLIKGLGFWYVKAVGITGFVDAGYLTGGPGYKPQFPVITPPPYQPQLPVSGNAYIRKTGKSLNLREQPTTSGRVLGSYKGGTSVKVTAYGTQWCSVIIPSTGMSGYMMTSFLGFDGASMAKRTVKYAPGNYVNLRTKPTLSQNTVAVRVPSGSRVTVITPWGAWSQVKYGRTTGYMMSDFLK